MRGNFVDRAHVEHLLGAVLTAQEENLASEFLSDLTGEVRRTESTIETGHIGIGLFELCMFCTCKREIAHNVKTVSATGSPTRNNADHNLGHEPNEPLHFKDVESAATRWVNCVGSFAVGVLVAVLAANSLIAAGAEGPATVSW
ncbi:unannotated protein [freshwater metagenome]|uniref:Unannotated protein n=1 Tax=freshwater metagenome TaxID=449393 RepID=A0A6J6E860_9ZZZZ